MEISQKLKVDQKYDPFFFFSIHNQSLKNIYS